MTNYISTTTFVRDDYDDTLRRFAANELINQYRVKPEDVTSEKIVAFLHGYVSSAQGACEFLDAKHSDSNEDNERWAYTINTDGTVEFEVEELMEAS
jgi:hypothetical protein